MGQGGDKALPQLSLQLKIGHRLFQALLVILQGKSSPHSIRDINCMIVYTIRISIGIVDAQISEVVIMINRWTIHRIAVPGQYLAPGKCLTGLQNVMQHLRKRLVYKLRTRRQEGAAEQFAVGKYRLIVRVDFFEHQIRPDPKRHCCGGPLENGFKLMALESQIGLNLFALLNVSTRAEPGGNAACGISDRRRAGLEPAICGIVASNSKFDVVAVLATDGSHPVRIDALSIVWVHGAVEPAEINVRLGLNPRVVQPLLAQVITVPIGAPRPH